MPSWADLKASFSLNRRDENYGPFFLPRDGNHGDVGYPLGFNLVNPKETLSTALNVVEDINRSINTIKTSSMDEVSQVGCATVAATIKSLIVGIFEFKDNLQSGNINANDVGTFASNAVSLTQACTSNSRQ